MVTRWVAVAMLAPLLAGCSMGSQNLSLGYADTESTSTGSAPLFRGGFAPRSPAPTPARTAQNETRVAGLDPSTSTGSDVSRFTKAPKGALADRDYSGAALDKQSALTLINAYRRENGLKTLKLDGSLERAAKMHSRDLAKWDRISHYGSDGSNPWDRVKRAGFKARLAAENVGTGQADLKEVFEGWKQSPGHNKNLLLADATHMGIALVKDPKTEFKTFWTLVLGTPL